MQRTGSRILIETDDWKSTREKVCEAYFCVPPKNKKLPNGLVVTKEKPVVLYFGDGDYSVAGIRELMRDYSTSDNSSIDQSFITSRGVKEKHTLETVVGWTKIKTSGDAAKRYVAAHIKDKCSALGIIALNSRENVLGKDMSGVPFGKEGNFVVIPCDDIDKSIGLTPEVASRAVVIPAKIFAKRFTLNAFPNVCTNINTVCDRPADLFESATKADTEITTEYLEETLHVVEEITKSNKVAYTKGDGRVTFYIGIGFKTVQAECRSKMDIMDLRSGYVTSYTVKNGVSGANCTGSERIPIIEAADKVDSSGK